MAGNFWTKMGKAAAIGAAVVMATPATAQNMSIRTLGAHETRLAGIAHRIAIANAGACAAPDMISGLVVHELAQYPAHARAAVANAFALRAGIGVLGIVAGSGAERAGLRIDDEILAVRGQSVEDAGAWTRRTPSYERVDRFHRHLSQALQHGPAELLVRRGGAHLRLTLAGQAGCGGLIKFVDSGSVNAWSDGRHIVLNRGIVAMSRSDDELAFIIGHEMAHNILGHSTGSGRASRAIFGRLVGAESPRNAESQADIAAVRLVSAGGFDPHGGVRFLASAQRRMWWAFSLDRPSFGGRMRNVLAAIDRDRARFPTYRVALRTNESAPAAALRGGR